MNSPIKLEDDLRCKEGFLTEIYLFLVRINTSHPYRWYMIEFAHLGFIGKLFKTSDLNMFIFTFLMYAEYKPVDILLGSVFSVLVCNEEATWVNILIQFDPNHVLWAIITQLTLNRIDAGIATFEEYE